MKAPQIIGLDMDGTLVQARDSWLSQGHRRCVEEIQARGITVALVTGRSLQTTAPTWHDLGLTCPIVCFNGTWVGYPNGHEIDSCALCENDVRDIIECLNTFPGGSISAYPDIYTWVMNSVNDVTHNWSEIYHTQIDVNPQYFAQRDGWHGASQKVLYAGPERTLQLVIQAVRRRFGTRFHIVQSQNDRFEIHRNVDKSWGLAVLAKYLDVDRAAVWAVGDDINDIEALEWAGESFAMGNANNRVRNAAKHILPSAVARGLCGLIPFIDRCS